MDKSAAYDGDVDGFHRFLLRQGRKRFSSPDAATEAALTAITDLARLERLAEAILTAGSWSDLLATP